MQAFGIAMLAATIIAAGAAVAAHEAGITDAFFGSRYDFDGRDCGQPLVSSSAPHDAAVVVAVENRGAAGTMRVCLFDEAGHKRLDETMSLAASSNTGEVFKVPPGRYGLITVVEHQGHAAVSRTLVDLTNCEARLAERWIDIRGASLTGGEKPAQCTQLAGADEAPAHMQQQGLMAPSVQPRLPGGGAAAAAATGAALSLSILLYAWTDLRLAIVGLFSRLQRPKVLDQQTRAKIHDLVQQDPGAHAAAIRDRLELGTSQTLHHLRVLVREGLLVRMGSLGRHHYFVKGRYAPSQMRLLAAMRHAPMRRAYQALVGRPDQSVQDLARCLGISIGRASKIASRLAREGLIERRPVGRTVRLRPLAR